MLFSSIASTARRYLMTYESFKQHLSDNLKEFFPVGTQISIRAFPHNNQLTLDGLTILEPHKNISPTIYLNYYFQQYQNGSSFLAIQQQILRYYHHHCPIDSIDTSFFTCFDQVRPRVAYKLIHFEKNRELLNEIPHFPYLNLAIVFYCLVSKPPYENASILIYNHHLDFWKISKNALLQIACENTPLLLPWCCNSLAELLLPMLDCIPSSEAIPSKETLEESSVPMYVLSNRQQYFGGACIRYPNVLKEISQSLVQDKLYILPSSIHEVILVPASQADNPAELAKIVQEVNLTEVAPDEVLSDSIYLYRQDIDQISLIHS